MERERDKEEKEKDIERGYRRHRGFCNFFSFVSCTETRRCALFVFFANEIIT